RLGTQKPPVYDVACFCCQQTVEKYFKALLHEQGLPVPRTHELDDLLDLLLPHDSTLNALRPGLDRLTSYAVDVRYPGIHADGRKFQSARRRTERVRQEIRNRLGIRPRRRKKP